MRAVFAVLAAALVLATAMAPHAHDGVFGSHACVACVTAGAEAAGSGAPEVLRPERVVATIAIEAPEPPVTGAPLGAVPGQSPPRAA